MMFTKSYARTAFLFLLCVLVLALPNLLRTSDNYMGEDPYFYSRLSGMIKDNTFSYDPLSYSGREFTYSLGQPSLFLFFSKVFTEKFTTNIIPIIFGLISSLLFYFILKKFYVEPNAIYLSLITLIISPPFIYIFSTYNEFTSITLILLTAFYLFIQDNKNLNFISYLLFFTIPFFGYQYSLLALTISFIYCSKAKKMKNFYTILIVSIISLAYIYTPLTFKYGLSETADFDKNVRYKGLFSDLGGSFGISIFILFLSIFGLNYLWKSKDKYLSFYLVLISLLVLILFYPTFIVYLNFALALLSGLGIIYLLRSRWESETIRKLTMWLLIIGLVFSTITFIGETSSRQPNQNLYDALIFLKENSKLEEVVLSHYSYGTLINSIANKKNVMDSRFLYSPDLNGRYNDLEKLFYTRDFNIAFNITDKYDIKYILITKEMRRGLVWSQENEGLLFLLNSVNNYRVIYENEEVEVWRYRK